MAKLNGGSWAELGGSAHNGGVSDTASASRSPNLIVGNDGAPVVAWTEETGWNQGGKVAWQVFDAQGKPMENAAGKADGVPVWSLAAAFATAEGFVIVY